MASTITVIPYLRPAPARIQAGPWLLDGSRQELGDQVPSWDPATQLILRRRVRLDVASCLQDCGLDTTATLYVASFWRTTQNQLVGQGTLVVVDLQVTEPLELQLRIPGHEVGGHLMLGTVVCLQDPGKTRHPLAPQTPGIILHEDTKRVALEGEAPRFPVSVVDFTAMGWPREAAWRLVWDHDDLEVSPSVALCLYVNREHPLVFGSLQNEDSTSRIIRSMLQADLARSILSFALRQEEFDPADWRDQQGTMGHVAASLLARIFPDESVVAVRSRLEKDPDRFWCQVQGSLRFLEDIQS